MSDRPNLYTADDLYDTGEVDDAGRSMRACCIFDSHRGQYIYDEIVTLGAVYGLDTGNVQRGPDGELTDELIEMSEEAITYLNDLPEFGENDLIFGWHDGDFMLANEAWWSVDA